jgi:hypothetical protein
VNVLQRWAFCNGEGALATGCPIGRRFAREICFAHEPEWKKLRSRWHAYCK